MGFISTIIRNVFVVNILDANHSSSLQNIQSKKNRKPTSAVIKTFFQDIIETRAMQKISRFQLNNVKNGIILMSGGITIYN